MYTIDDARREARDLVEEGYGFDYIRCFLYDLARGNDITWDDVEVIMTEILLGEYSIDCAFGTL